MNVVFAGTPEFARVALEAIHAAGHVVKLVLTQPDRPAGRGMQMQASPVKQAAQALGIAIAQPTGLRLNGKYAEEAWAAHELLAATPYDVMVVAAYGLILPQTVLHLAPHGGLNIHASLLPRWRGAAPIHRAIEAGDAETGITIMQMDAGLDTGAMLLRAAEPIRADDTTGTLHDRLAVLGGEQIVAALAQLGQLTPVAQPAEGMTYAAKIAKHEAQLDWHQPATLLARRIRAFNPFPGATATLDGIAIKLWMAHVDAVHTAPASLLAPGTVVSAGSAGVIVACGEASRLCITELQKPGGRRLPVAQFLAGHALSAGMRFTVPEDTAH